MSSAVQTMWLVLQIAICCQTLCVKIFMVGATRLSCRILCNFRSWAGARVAIFGAIFYCLVVSSC